MRNIKFRGNSTYDKKQVYGSLIKKRFTTFSDWMIEDENGLGSDIETDSISQFTGEYDENGKEIYENDILTFKNKSKYKVVFQNGCFYLFHFEGLKEIDDTPYRWGPMYRIKELGLSAVLL